MSHLKSKLKHSLNNTSSSSIFKQGGTTLKNQNQKNRIYIPINQSSPQQNNNNFKEEENHIIQLRRSNNQLKEKQELYIDKLIKLQEGLEKQHFQFMQLQDLYNELFVSYKQKEEQISELQMNFRESQRKKVLNSYSLLQSHKKIEQTSHNEEQLNDYKAALDDKSSKIQQLQVALQQNIKKVQRLATLEKTNEKLHIELNYHKSKEKMQDSRASLNSKVFEQLEEWQKMADLQKEERIKIQYQNEFLKDRNSDLEGRVKDLEQILSQKQIQIAKMRQEKINLRRENSEARLSKSRSKSPRNLNETGSPVKQKANLAITNSIIDQLYKENKILREEIAALKAELMKKITNRISKPEDILNYNSGNSFNSNPIYIREQQFFSFSRDELPVANNTSRERIMDNQIRLAQNTEQKHDTTMDVKSQEDNNNLGKDNIQDLQELPANLQIDELIRRSGKKQIFLKSEEKKQLELTPPQEAKILQFQFV